MFKIKRDVAIHFVGIGGIGMSGIAEVLLGLGYTVSGSDIKESVATKKLQDLGAEIFIGHAAGNIKNATIIVYTSAAKFDNPELKLARENDIPILKRAEMLAQLMRLKSGLAVAGTHGKTTTTSFLVTILEECGLSPTFFIGGIVENLKGHARVGTGDFLVAEADESDGSFLLLNPIMSIITNIDLDHMDYYKDEATLIDAFKKFANNVPFYGLIAINAHDERLQLLKHVIKSPVATFGIECKATFVAKNVEYSLFGSNYDLYYKDELQQKIKINLPGSHNVLNSLAAIALAHNLNISFTDIAQSILKFVGVGRRFQLIHSREDFEVIDDYAHHPTEIKATLKAIRETRAKKKIVVIFEPHRFSRTKECWGEFFHCFNAADEMYISDIYAAAESPIEGITARRLTADINAIHPQFCQHFGAIEDMDKIVKSFADQAVCVITLGAGSIGSKVKQINFSGTENTQKACMPAD